MQISIASNDAFFPVMTSPEKKERNEKSHKQLSSQQPTTTRRFKLSLEAITLLKEIGVAKNSKDMAELSDQLGFKRSTTAANLTKMCKYGLISLEKTNQPFPFGRTTIYKTTALAKSLLISLSESA